MRALILLISVFLTSGLSYGAVEGEAAPAFKLQGLIDNSAISLSDYAGKVVYLDFWASWCAPCRISFPEIIKLKQDFSDRPFEVLAINVDEKTADAERFLRRYQANYPILNDSTGAIAALYELPGMPTSFVIDQTGVITVRHTGFKPGDMDKIRRQIESLLQERAP